MTKQEWQQHIIEVEGAPSPNVDRAEFSRIAKRHQALYPDCPDCRRRQTTKRRSAAGRARHEAYLAAGLVRVRGALGGIYYE